MAFGNNIALRDLKFHLPLFNLQTAAAFFLLILTDLAVW